MIVLRVQRLWRLFAAMALLLASNPAAAQLTTKVVSVDVRPGTTMKYLEIAASARPTAAVVLMAGGDGVLDLSPAGQIGTDLNLNFLMRTRHQFARAGMIVAAIDVASDQKGGLNGDVRLSARHAQDIVKVIASLRKRHDVPVWLVGTSASTISAVSVAARFPSPQSGGPDGIVLTSSLTVLAKGLCGRSIYFATLAEIRVPVLSIGHDKDACPCSPGGVEVGRKMMSALKQSPRKEHKVWSGGDPPLSKQPCWARTPHGFLGVENEVVGTIVAWIVRG
jgi:hypothetical protein